MRHGFLPGDELVQSSTGHALYVVERVQPRIQRIEVLDVERRQKDLLDETELRSQVAAGDIRVRRRGVDWETGLDRRSDTDSKVHETHQALMRFLKELKRLRSDCGVSFNRAYEILVKEAGSVESTDEKKLPSRSHAYKLWKRDRDGLPLHKGHAAKGNRTPRYPEEVLNKVKDLAEQQFLLTHSRWTQRSLTELVNQQLHDSGSLPLNKNVSKAFVQRVVLTQVHADPEHRRLHPHDAIAAKAVARHKIRIAGPFERVEQDALHLPWLIRTPYGDSTNVYLVHAIDCSTSLVLGWHLVIGAPRAHSTLMCIETILFPKARRFEKLGLKYDFDVFGTPALLVVDNGPENKGDSLLRLTRLSIDVDRLKARHAHQKPFIERLNRSLKVYLETLPGCTRLDGKDGKRDPAALGDPVMTLDEMERWIVRFYFEHWANKPLRRLADSVFVDNEDLGITPLKRYRMLTEQLGYPVPLPPSLHAWRSVVFEQHSLTLSRKNGVGYKKYKFRGDRLPYLISQFGETKVTVLIDPDDFRVVHIVDRDDFTLIPLVNSSIDDRTPAYSFVQADMKLKEAAEEGESVALEAVRRDVFNRSIEPRPNARKSTRVGKASGVKASASRETAKVARSDEAVNRAGINPLPSRIRTLGNPALGTDEDDWGSVSPLQVVDRRSGETRP